MPLNARAFLGNYLKDKEPETYLQKPLMTFNQVRISRPKSKDKRALFLTPYSLLFDPFHK